jgi:DNA primase
MLSPRIDPRRLYAVNAEAARFYAAQLRRGHPPAARYLRTHGIAHAARPDSPWQLGYAPPAWRGLTNHLAARGFTDAEMSAAGLTAHNRNGALIDRFRDRLVFPVHNPQGDVAAFTARDLSGDRDSPKYLNTPQTPVYRKSELLYGLAPHQLDQIKRQPHATPLAIVVEGAADALAVQRIAGETSGPGRAPVVAVAPCGTALTDNHVRQLHQQLPGADLAVAFDGDPAGREAFARTYPHLRHWPGRRYGIELPDGADPAELVADHGPERARAELAQRTQPAARMALAYRLASLTAAGHITRPQEWPADRLLAYEVSAPYFADDPADTPQLARTAAQQLGIHEGEVARGVIEHTFPDAGPPELSPAAHGPTSQPTGDALARVQRANEALTARGQTAPAPAPAELGASTATPQRSPCLTNEP